MKRYRSFLPANNSDLWLNQDPEAEGDFDPSDPKSTDFGPRLIRFVVGLFDEDQQVGFMNMEQQE